MSDSSQQSSQSQSVKSMQVQQQQQKPRKTNKLKKKKVNEQSQSQQIEDIQQELQKIFLEQQARVGTLRHTTRNRDLPYSFQQLDKILVQPDDQDIYDREIFEVAIDMLAKKGKFRTNPEAATAFILEMIHFFATPRAGHMKEWENLIKYICVYTGIKTMSHPNRQFINHSISRFAQQLKRQSQLR